MKIVYAGSPQYAVAPLEALLAAGAEIVAVITQPDKPFGRKRVLTPTPVKQLALSRGLPVYDFNPADNTALLKGLGAELMITCAYGRILTQEVLDIFSKGVYNLHASLLPRHRGASPIQAAILAGDEYTGVTVMKTERGLDCGGILLVKRIEICGQTCGELSQKLSALSAEAAIEAVEMIERGEERIISQDEAAATYCKKIEKKDGEISFSEPAAKVINLINAMSPSPAAYAYLNGSPVNLLKARAAEGEGACGEVIRADKRGICVACADGAAEIITLQFAGGKPQSAADAVNGRKIKVGDKFD